MATRPIVKPLADDVLYWNIMMYADPGAGKTVFAGSDLKVLFIAPEKDGLMSAQTLGSKAHRILIPNWETLINTYEWYDENPDELSEYDVISIDSVTEMQHLAKDYTLRMGAEEKRRKGRDPDKMEIQDYGTMHELLENMVRGFNDVQCNVLYTATAKMVEGPDKETFLVPDLQGKKEYGVAMKIASLMTCYGYMRVETHDVAAPTAEDAKAIKQVRRRVIYWEDTGTIRGKDRSNKLKPFTLNANLQQVRRAIKGDYIRNPEGFLVKKAVTPAKAVAKKAVKPTVEKVVEATQKVNNEVDKEVKTDMDREIADAEGRRSKTEVQQQTSPQDSQSVVESKPELITDKGVMSAQGEMIHPGKNVEKEAKTDLDLEAAVEA